MYFPLSVKKTAASTAATTSMTTTPSVTLRKSSGGSETQLRSALKSLRKLLGSETDEVKIAKIVDDFTAVQGVYTIEGSTETARSLSLIAPPAIMDRTPPLFIGSLNVQFSVTSSNLKWRKKWTMAGGTPTPAKDTSGAMLLEVVRQYSIFAIVERYAFPREKMPSNMERQARLLQSCNQ
jgi:hypothetical protein